MWLHYPLLRNPDSYKVRLCFIVLSVTVCTIGYICLIWLIILVNGRITPRCWNIFQYYLKLVKLKHNLVPLVVTAHDILHLFMSLTVSIRDTIVFIYHEELCCNIYAFALTVFSYITTIIFLSQYNHFNILNVMFECIDAMILTTFLLYHIYSAVHY